MTWDDFRVRLEKALAAMAIESFLILTLPADSAGERCYVQFAHWADDVGSSAGLRYEAVGSEYLPPTRPLTPVQEERVLGLGLLPPPAGDVCRNYRTTWPTPAPFAAVAELAVRTLREVFGVEAPGDLRARYASFGGADPPPLDLGLEPFEPAPRPGSKPASAMLVARLAPTVEDGLRRWFGVEELRRDEDGDYPIRIGSTVVFVRVVDGRPPIVAVFSPILDGIDASPALFAALNNANAHVRYARAFWVPRRIIVATELPGMELTADLIGIVCAEVGSVADQLDDVLHGRFGGMMPLGVSRPELPN